MSDHTKIEWTDATANVINGCSVHSPGCTNCYAMRLAGTRLQHHPTRAGLTQPSKAGPVWTGEVRFHEPALLQVPRWKRPRKIFWNAHGDLFHESVPDTWIDRCFAAMALTPQHIHQVLTKRSARMREYLSTRAGDWQIIWPEYADQSWMQDKPVRPVDFPLRNVWLGVSVVDQQRADERIPDLLATPAAVRWISAEPMLGPVDLRKIATMRWRGAERLNALTGKLSGMFGDHCPTRLSKLDWVIAGGESGPGARPMHPDWARSLRDLCADAGTPFLFKQWGEWAEVDQFDPTSDSVYHWDAKRYGQPRYRSIALGIDGRAGPRADDLPAPTACVYQVGKKAAARLLDGVEHNGFPKGG